MLIVNPPPTVAAAVAYDTALQFMVKAGWAGPDTTGLRWVQERLGELKDDMGTQPHEAKLLAAMCEFIAFELSELAPK